MFNPMKYSYLQFDTAVYAPEPEASETADSLVVTEWNFSKQHPL
jgi:hypothetical protein